VVVKILKPTKFQKMKQFSFLVGTKILVSSSYAQVGIRVLGYPPNELKKRSKKRELKAWNQTWEASCFPSRSNNLNINISNS